MLNLNREDIRNYIAGSGYVFYSEDSFAIHQTVVEKRIAELATSILLNMPPRLEKKRFAHQVELVLSDSTLKMIASIMRKSFGISTVEMSCEMSLHGDENYFGKTFKHEKVCRYTLSFDWLTFDGIDATSKTHQEDASFKFSPEAHYLKLYAHAAQQRDRIIHYFGEKKLLCGHEQVLGAYCSTEIYQDLLSKRYSYEIFKAIFDFVYLTRFPEFDSFDTLKQFAEAVQRYEVTDLINWSTVKVAEYVKKFGDPSNDFPRSLDLASETKNVELMEKCIIRAADRTDCLTTLLQKININNAALIAGCSKLYEYPSIAQSVTKQIACLASSVK